MKLVEHSRIGTLTVSKVLARQALQTWSVSAGTLAVDALRLIAEGDVGALVVVSGERFAGMFSERDYLRQVVLGNAAAVDASVGELMCPCVFSATPQQRAQECLALMTERKLRHLPVLEQGRVFGVLSLDALLYALVAHQESAFAAFELDQRILFLQGTYSC